MDITDLQSFIIHLSLIPGIGSGVIEKLIKKCKDLLTNMYALSYHDIVERGIHPKTAQALIEGLKDRTAVDAEKHLLKKHGLTVITLLDSEYPDYLKNIYLPPPLLYVQGDASLLSSTCLSVVGSRKATEYGRQCVSYLLEPVLDAGVTIVSGGAYGIDAAAHRCATNATGRTIAVLGSGLLRPYPLLHKELFKTIVDKGGAIVSCFPLASQATQWTFPTRNRIIAGLSSATLVIQAAATSGALITARYALDENRQIFTVPGSIFEPVSKGCHELVKEGAVLVDSGEALLKELGITQKIACAQATLLETTKEEPQESTFLFHLSCPISVDELSVKTGKSENELKNMLFDLQLEGVIEQDFSGLWHKI